eukprot:3498939-Lingulodinium_polyedra.AAC.1
MHQRIAARRAQRALPVGRPEREIQMHCSVGEGSNCTEPEAFCVCFIPAGCLDTVATADSSAHTGIALTHARVRARQRLRLVKFRGRVGPEI